MPVIHSPFILVNSSSYNKYEFSIYPETRLDCSFSVSNNNGSGIKIFVMNETSFFSWKNGTGFNPYYDNGAVTNGSTALFPPPGTYYIVFDNTFSAIPKNVTEQVTTVF